MHLTSGFRRRDASQQTEGEDGKVETKERKTEKQKEKEATIMKKERQSEDKLIENEEDDEKSMPL